MNDNVPGDRGVPYTPGTFIKKDGKSELRYNSDSNV